MRQRGNEIVFHALGARDLLGHIVDVVAQLADLVVIDFLQAHPIAPCGDFLDDLVDAHDRLEDGFQEIAVGQDHKQDEHHPDQQRQQDNPVDLAFGDGQ